MGDIRSGLTDMWRSVLLFLPKAVLFAAILIVGWLLARVARKLVTRALERVGFDRLVRRGGVGRALARGDYDTSDILARLAYYGLLLLTLQLAFGVWGSNPVSDLIAVVVSWLPKAFVAIVIVVVAAAIASAVKDLITGALGGLSYRQVVANVASWFIIGLGVIAALNQVDIATTVTTPVLIAALATVAGILIVGVGGGLIRPMSQRWERWLDRAETETHIVKEQTKGYAAGRGDVGREMADWNAGEPTQVLPRTDPVPPPADVELTQPLPGADYTQAFVDDDQTQVLPRTSAPPFPQSSTAQAGHDPCDETGSGGGPADETQRINPR